MKPKSEQRLISTVAAIALAVTGALAGSSPVAAGILGWGSRAQEEEPAGPPPATAPAPPAAPAPAVPPVPSFAGVARTIQPAVVNVSTAASARPATKEDPRPMPFGENDPFQEFFRRFFDQPGPGMPGEDPGRPDPQRSVGSGVIIDPAGFIVTNAHVVQGADKITIKLKDDRELKADLVGIDEKTDVALLRVQTKEALPAATLGDSDQLEVGDWVVAVGNPFGLTETITAGIVSAKGRIIGAGPYDDFIQTDASINPGNSGGPLVDLHGRVVGINAVIYSQSGGNIGIGFAIPINLVRSVVQQLKEHGKVVRGYIGVGIQQVTPDMASALKLDTAHGALVGNVYPEGPAAQAGIKVGDVIVEFDGKRIDTAHQLPALVAATPVGNSARVRVLREAGEQEFTITIAEMPVQETAAATDRGSNWGFSVAAIDAKAARRFRLERHEGVVVTEVERGASADEAGLRPGDVIVRVGQTPITSLADYNKAVGALGDADRMLVLVARGTDSFFAVLQRGG